MNTPQQLQSGHIILPGDDPKTRRAKVVRANILGTNGVPYLKHKLSEALRQREWEEAARLQEEIRSAGKKR